MVMRVMAGRVLVLMSVVSCWANGNPYEIVPASAYRNNPAGEIGFGIPETWLTDAPLPAPCGFFGMAACYGAIYTSGGFDGATPIMTNVFRFDGTAWTEVRGLPAPRAGSGAVALDGSLYLVGGGDGTLAAQTNVFRFDGTNWSEVAGLPAPRLMSGVAIWNGAIFVIGGEGTDSTWSDIRTNVFRFDGTNWTEVRGLPVARAGLGAGALGGRLYAVGGASDGGLPQTVHSNVFAFDGTNWSEVAGLPRRLNYHTVSVRDGRLYSLGGLDQTVGAYSNATYFDGITWREGAGLTTGVYGAQSAVLNGTLYLAGSLDGLGAPHAETYRYRPYAFDPGVIPSNGPVTGGVVVVITGTNLCDGTLGDVAGVTLCGAPATVLSVAGSTQLVVRAGPAVVPGQGDVAVFSTALGVTVGANRFFYKGSALRVLGVNSAVIASGEAATLATGTGFGEQPVGAGALTNVLRVANSGNEALAFGGVAMNGAPVGMFRLEGLPATLAVGETGTCRLVFAPSAAGAFTAALHVAHNGAASPFVLNVSGTALKHAQSITFVAATNQVETARVGLRASASSGLPVTFVVAAGPGVLAGGTNLSFTATGVVSVIASQPGNALFEAAPDLARTFRVRRPQGGDFAGDGRTSLTLFDASTGNWFSLDPDGHLLLWAEDWGGPGFVPVPGDYNGDGREDLAVYSAGFGTWFIRTLAGEVLAWNTAFGGPGLIPVPGDYDGDHVADLALYGARNGDWYVATVDLTLLAWAEGWGGLGMAAVAGDYDGDTLSDLAVFDRGAGLWYVRRLDGDAILWAESWGGAGYWPVSGDYDGDARSDLAVYHASTGMWYVRAATGAVLVWAFPLGGPGFEPVSGDFDGDGRSDLAVYSSSLGQWFVYSPDNGVRVWGEAFGGPGLRPVR